MTDEHRAPSNDQAEQDSSPFGSFDQEPVMARDSTASAPPPQSVRRRSSFRRLTMQPGFLALLLALVVAVPVVFATLPRPGGDNAGEPSVGAPAPSETQRSAPSTTAPGPDPRADEQRVDAYEDCIEKVARLPGRCEALLSDETSGATLYLDCRRAGIAADRCIKPFAE
jgi:hypothetical protein